MKKKFFRFVVFSIFLFSYLGYYAQLSPEGKTYKAHLSSVCKKMEGGGCNIDTYQVMEFIKDKVTIYRLVKASCTPKEREDSYNNKEGPIKYTRYWSVKDNKLFIEKYDEYGKMEIKDAKIIAKKGSAVTEFLEEK